MMRGIKMTKKLLVDYVQCVLFNVRDLNLPLSKTGQITFCLALLESLNQLPDTEGQENG